MSKSFVFFDDGFCHHVWQFGVFFVFRSRKVIDEAVIGLLLFFYSSKNLNCIGALSFFKICSHIFMTFEVKLEQ